MSEPFRRFSSECPYQADQKGFENSAVVEGRVINLPLLERAEELEMKEFEIPGGLKKLFEKFASLRASRKEIPDDLVAELNLKAEILFSRLSPLVRTPDEAVDIFFDLELALDPP